MVSRHEMERKVTRPIRPFTPSNTPTTFRFLLRIIQATRRDFHCLICLVKYRQNFSFQGNEARLYEYIVRHFLACCSQDARGQETTVEILIEEEKFKASGLMILARNYLDVYTYESWSDKVDSETNASVKKPTQFYSMLCLHIADDTGIF